MVALATCDRGGAAVEFALIGPLLFTLMVGTLYIGLLVFSAVGLQNAVEAGARCYSVNSSLCSTPAAAKTYASAAYYGVGSPTFTATTAACGHQVSATLSFELNAVLVNLNEPLNATACFP
jgi:Flp pilus assembly protein TadG